jgi:hypothetical protein
VSDSEFEIVKANPNPILRRLVRVRGVEFDEAFVAELIGNSKQRRPSRGVFHFYPSISKETPWASGMVRP